MELSGYNACARCRVAPSTLKSAQTKKRKATRQEEEARRLSRYAEQSQTAAAALDARAARANADQPEPAPHAARAPPNPVAPPTATAPKILRHSSSATIDAKAPGDEVFCALTSRLGPPEARRRTEPS